MRGSGGIVLLVERWILQDWSVEVVDVQLEDVMWVKFQQKQTSHVFFVAVCYLPPASSSRDVDIEERVHVLGDQVKQFKMEGQVVVCGDFNARCGGLSCSVDLVENSKGELLVVLMESCGLAFVNGRQSLDQFTCISARGRSVVDYCLVPEDELQSIQNFAVKTMSEYEELYVCEKGYSA